MTLEEAIKIIRKYELIRKYECNKEHYEACEIATKALKQTRWIPVSERLPEDLEPVNITWINHNPESYYADIKDKPFTATAHYYKGRWYWYSSTTEDMLAEYGRCDSEEFDEAIEVIAWMPLPQPMKVGEENC